MSRNNGAGVLMVCRKTDRALVLRRSALVPGPLTWSIPGGGTEPADGSTRYTAIRECAEETGHAPSGIICSIGKLLKPDRSSFTVFLSLEPREFRPRLDWENDAARWVDFDEMLALTPKYPPFEAMLAYPPIRDGLYRTMVHPWLTEHG